MPSMWGKVDMPAIIPALVAIGSAVGAGTSIYSLVNRPSTPDTSKQLQQAQEKQAQADQQARQKAILASLPNAQEQGGGALNAPSLTDLAAVIAGLPGETNTAAGKGALSAFLGSTPQTGASTNQSSQSGGNLVESTYGLSGSQG